MAGGKRKRKAGKKKPIRIRIGKIFLDILICFLALTMIPVLVYRVIQPPTTALMWIRGMEDGGGAKDIPRTVRRWKPLNEISPSLLKAVIAAEDQKFFRHNGFDWQAIESAVKTNLTTDRTVGASTISMQTARNVFLWQGRNWLRKSLEAYFTFLIEVFWSKERILEIYLNVIEWGDGIFGCEAASRTYFNRSAGSLSPVESAWMAAILPNPRVWSIKSPQKFVEDRQLQILNVMARTRLPRSG
ncbi:MAG: monofunctional biosynthetic peptidoglycan transglycosylase [Nitrospinaceae bacterium]